MICSDAAYRFADTFLGQFRTDIMIIYINLYLMNRIVIKFQPVQNIGCKLTADLCMPVKMIHALFIGGAHKRFPKIMKQCRKTQTFVIFNVSECLQFVYPNIPAMMGIILFGLHCPVKFRKNDCSDAILPGPQI